MIWIAGAVLFLVVLFLIKIGFNPFGFLFKHPGQAQNENGLSYNNATIGDLVSKDTDGDGVPDWEEQIMGTDPTKKETTPGIPDAVAIQKLQAQQTETSGQTATTGQASENLTKTEQFSRELFTTAAAASQTGQPLDQATIDQIGSSLADNIKNVPQRKVFTISDLKLTNSSSVQTLQKYLDYFNGAYPKTQLKYTVVDVMQKFVADGNTPNTSALLMLDPIIKQVNDFRDALIKTTVPQIFSSLHLNTLNAVEKVSENLNDMKLFETDPVVALGAMSQYGTSTYTLGMAINNLNSFIEQRLKK